MGIRRNAPWSDLPHELLTTISTSLTSNPLDSLAFRAVCKSWYISSCPIYPLTLSRILPITIPYPPYSFDGRFFNSNFGVPILSPTSIFLIRHPEHVTQSWVMFADQLTPGKLMIRRPFTKCYYSMPMNFPKYIDVPNVYVEEIGRFYNLSFHSEVNKPPSMWSMYVSKVVLSSNGSYAIVLFQTGILGVLKLKMGLHFEWDPISPCCYDTIQIRVRDIINYKGHILAVDTIGRLYDMNLSSYQSKLIAPLIDSCFAMGKRLVESNGMLYLVLTDGVGEEERIGENDGFKVFQFDANLYQWVQVSSVDNMIFFFGFEFSFSISPHQLGASLGKDCIVYKERSFKKYGEVVNAYESSEAKGEGGGFRIRIWHMADTSYRGSNGLYHGGIDVLWPPPTWLWSIDMSKRIEDLEAAIDDVVINASEKLKAISKEVTPLEQVTVMENGITQQDISEIWSPAQGLKARISEARCILTNLESNKTNAVSRQQLCKSMNLQNQVGSSSCGAEEWQAPVDSIHNAPKCCETSDVFISSEMKLNGMILHLEEFTTKLLNTLKCRQQPPVNAPE